MRKHIWYILAEKGVEKYLIKFFRETFDPKKKYELKLKARVTNIHRSFTLPIKCQNLLQKIIPQLEKENKILSLEIGQEDNIPCPISSDKLLHDSVQFIVVTIRLKNPKASLRLQLSKNKEKTHLTLILSTHCEESEKLISILENVVDLP